MAALFPIPFYAMSLVTWFVAAPSKFRIPVSFPNPFDSEPCPIAREAARHLQDSLTKTFDGIWDFHAEAGGHMFGVLVVQGQDNRIGYLAAFSGALAGRNTWPGFVPPTFDTGQIETAPRVIGNWLGEERGIAEFYTGPFKPEGVGECAGTKLIHYAYKQGLTPLAMAEFWWGGSARGEVRHHGQFYPSCRGKCYPILPFMLRGIEVQPEPVPGGHEFTAEEPSVVYEDADLVVVNKPSGMLSVPGKLIRDSVLTRLQGRYPDATGPLILHRLDLATSGLLVAAKNAQAHKALQRQFESRQVEKRYVAVLSRRLPEGMDEGVIDLPLRVDMDDRPRQVVCDRYGKPSRTRWQVLARGEATTRVYFYPLTGRTHQLRMHAAHRDGLDAPIVGDELYGRAADRLMLHAERLVIIHPSTGDAVELTAPSPF